MLFCLDLPTVCLLASRLVRRPVCRPVRLHVTLFNRSAVFGLVAMVNHRLFHELFVPLVFAVSVGLLWVHSSGRLVFVVASLAVAKLTPYTIATTSNAATATATDQQPAANICGKSYCGCCPATKHTHTHQHMSTCWRWRGINAWMCDSNTSVVYVSTSVAATLWCWHFIHHNATLILYVFFVFLVYVCLCSFFVTLVFLDGEWVIYSLVNVFPQLHKAFGVMSQKQQ